MCHTVDNGRKSFYLHQYLRCCAQLSVPRPCIYQMVGQLYYLLFIYLF